jgi:small basic protein
MTSKTAQIVGLIAAYGFVILLVNTIHFQLFPVRVVLYDSILDVVIAGGIVVAAYFTRLPAVSAMTGAEAWLALLVGLLGGLLFAISVPTVFDRSLSLYILEKIDQRGGGIRQNAFGQVFRDEYLTEHRLVDIRLTEQINSGTIFISGGCVGLTAKGRRIVAFSRFYRTHMLPKRREIMGRLTDDLTDPFRNSIKAPDYLCQP